MKKRLPFIVIMLALMFAGCSSDAGTADNNKQNDASKSSAGQDISGTQDKTADKETQQGKDSPSNNDTGEKSSTKNDDVKPQPTNAPTSAPAEEASVTALANAKIGDIITFGSWWSGDREKIEWIVLDENENGLLLISRYVLKEMGYNEVGDFEYEEMMHDVVDWDTCAARTYLNDELYKNAFSKAERAKIKSVKNVNEYVFDGVTRGGRDTTDHLFLLSLEEAKRYFGVNYWDDYYMTGFSEATITEPLPGSNMSWHIMDEDDYNNSYADMGYSKDCIGKKGTPWWFRTPAWYGASYNGYLGDASYSGAGLRPVMYVTR